jgi:hypothetical protein
VAYIGFTFAPLPNTSQAHGGIPANQRTEVDGRRRTSRWSGCKAGHYVRREKSRTGPDPARRAGTCVERTLQRARVRGG